MSISIKEIEHLANLAHLDLTAEEKTKYQKDISGVLAYVDKIKNLQINAGLLEDAVSISHFRADKIVDCSAEDQKQIVAGFPEKEGNLNKVKAVFE